jgi:hypothetical protein
MAITIDGNGNITGLLAGGLPDLSITNADLATNAVSTSKVLDGAVTTAKLGSAEQSGLCKAWVNFNGTTASPSTIRASYNVSSVTKNGTGDYTVNFAAAMVDANYNIVGGASSTGGFCVSLAMVNGYGRTGSASTTAVRMFIHNNSNTSVDEGYVSISIFR